MAELNLFHYFPGSSTLHRRDSRVKLAVAVMFFLGVGFAGQTRELAVLSLVTIAGLIISRLPIGRLLCEIKYIIFLSIIVLVFRAFSVPGMPLIRLPFGDVTVEGLWAGLLFGWRLLLMVLISAVLTGTTGLSDLRDAIEWFLRPIPLVPEARIATMFNLTFAFIPLLFSQAAEISEAQKARCVEGTRNPIRRIRCFVYPFLTHALLRAEETALAMESRCYSEQRTPATFKAGWGDWGLLGMAVMVGVGVVLLA